MLFKARRVLNLSTAVIVLFAGCLSISVVAEAEENQRYNVLFIISDDLTYTALSCYGNQICQTPNIDRLAQRGVRFTRAFCQGTYCGPSRASFMSGYYPHASGVLGYQSPRQAIGDRQTWPQLFKDNGYYTARVSKLFHMGVPINIEKGNDSSDDSLSWTEKFNSKGPEWRAPGDGETLEGVPPGETMPPKGGNTFVIVEADGDDLVHSDGKTAQKAVELIQQHKDKPFWLGVGFVRPHVPFVAPREYYEPFKPFTKLKLPEKIEGDWDDIPKAGINYKTSLNMKMDLREQKTALGAYYASVAYMDAQVGKVLDALDDAKIADKTIVVFTSDHGYHLGEHDFWAKVSLLDESSGVPLIISVPGKKPAVSDAFIELIDLYPTVASLCGLKAPEHVQGKDASKLLDKPKASVRDHIFCVAPMRRGFLIRDNDYAYIQYGEDARGGIELYDMNKDPKQYTNLAKLPEYAELVQQYQKQMTTKLSSIRDNDLN